MTAQTNPAQPSVHLRVSGRTAAYLDILRKRERIVPSLNAMATHILDRAVLNEIEALGIGATSDATTCSAPEHVASVDGGRLSAALQRAGWTRGDLARHLGIDKSSVRNVEIGKAPLAECCGGVVLVWVEQQEAAK